MEVKQWSCLVLLTEHNLESVKLVFYITGPSDGIDQFGFKKASSSQYHSLQKTVIHFHVRRLLLTLD